MYTVYALSLVSGLYVTLYSGNDETFARNVAYNAVSLPVEYSQYSIAAVHTAYDVIARMFRHEQ